MGTKKKNNSSEKAVEKKYMIVDNDGVIIDAGLDLDEVKDLITCNYHEGEEVSCYTVYELGNMFSIDVKQTVDLVQIK